MQQTSKSTGLKETEKFMQWLFTQININTSAHITAKKWRKKKAQKRDSLVRNSKVKIE